MSEPREKRILTLSEAHQVLEKIDVEKADQIQKRTLDYTSKFAKTSSESAKKLRKQLENDCGLSAEEAVEVVNIMPKVHRGAQDLHCGMEEASSYGDPREGAAHPEDRQGQLRTAFLRLPK